MNNSKFLGGILAGLCALAFQANAQTMFQVNLKGTSQTTNDAGEIVSTQINNKTLIQDALTAKGGTNDSSLIVVYVQSASTDPSTPGDFIEVLNSTNGAILFTNLQFMYGGFFPAALTNAAQTEVVIGAQVIPQPLAIGDSLGGATINERFSPKKTTIRGSFNYTALRAPDSSSTIRVCNGTFSTTKPFTPPE